MVGNLNSRILGIIGMAILFAGVVGAVEYKPERYDLILDRSPFGIDPLLGGADDAAAAAQEDAAAKAAAAAAAKEIRLCFLFETEQGEIRAGFENKKAKPGDPNNPKNIILKVGESFKGMKLTDISLENSQAILTRSGKRVIFELTKAPTAAKAPPVKAAPKRRLGGGFRQAAPKQPAKPPEPELTPEERAAKSEALRKKLQDYQMHIIRTGLPPLPLPLTQEMDDQLVAEGVLPPE